MKLQKQTNYLLENTENPDSSRYTVVRVLDFNKDQVLLAKVTDFKEMLSKPYDRDIVGKTKINNFDERTLLSQCWNLGECCTMMDIMEDGNLYDQHMNNWKVLRNTGEQTGHSLKSRNEEAWNCRSIHSNKTVNFAKAILKALHENDLNTAFNLTDKQYS